jgi:hypothetical protein
LLHDEFGNHLVLALEFRLKRRDLAVSEIKSPLLRPLERSGAVVRELLFAPCRTAWA